MADNLSKVRLDKWLWAARFFKTRALAKAAIEGGKVHIDGQRAKASKEIRNGITIEVRQGRDEKVVVVTALSDQRRGATEAAVLYRETEDSIARREAAAAQRKALRLSDAAPPGRPSKKQRRQIHRFREQDR